MEDIEIPQYFICPISLQIMKDPVTAITGITYDRESIEQWLSSNPTCPATKQPLPADSGLTPNHTLRRLIQAWCTSKGVDRIPTPKSPLTKTHILKLIQNLFVPQLHSNSLKMLVSLASENEINRRYMVEAGVGKAMVSWIVRCFKETRPDRLEDVLNVLHQLRIPNDEVKLLLIENYDFIDSITWVLGQEMDNHVTVKTNAVLVLKPFIQAASSNLLERLKPEFFQGLIQVLRDRISRQATKGTLQVLLETCPWGRNRLKIIEAGAVSELIEMELMMPEKRISELILGVLDYLCTCADGRAQLLGHAAGIAVVTKRMLRVSPAANESLVHILASIAKFSATNEVLKEMLRVGAVSKLCMALQAECGGNVKEKARWILRLHSNVWSSSPCVAVYLLTRDPSAPNNFCCLSVADSRDAIGISSNPISRTNTECGRGGFLGKLMEFDHQIAAANVGLRGTSQENLRRSHSRGGYFGFEEIENPAVDSAIGMTEVVYNDEEDAERDLRLEEEQIVGGDGHRLCWVLSAPLPLLLCNFKAIIRFPYTSDGTDMHKRWYLDGRNLHADGGEELTQLHQCAKEKC
ncbi:hypothetical protein NE237_003785 [Protea cynaroides]|uniref:U-box domain-containing protein n=1 Tax=Protea cynaroides TaxID=273540 RepID=A0A9Q0KI31_9MAGN|nr:hypothetical protein NE237_003785 [Protea cynaroides]